MRSRDVPTDAMSSATPAAARAYRPALARSIGTSWNVAPSGPTKTIRFPTVAMTVVARPPARPAIQAAIATAAIRTTKPVSPPISALRTTFASNAAMPMPHPTAIRPPRPIRRRPQPATSSRARPRAARMPLVVRPPAAVGWVKLDVSLAALCPTDTTRARSCQARCDPSGRSDAMRVQRPVMAVDAISAVSGVPFAGGGRDGTRAERSNRILTMTRPLRIAHVAPPLERVPPLAYGGTERIVYELVTELDRRGHEITTFASGDSEVPGRLVPTVPAALRPEGYTGDPMPYFLATMRAVLDRASDFDLIHSHLEWASLLLARVSPVPVVSTFHGRLDLPWAGEALTDPPAGLVADQREPGLDPPGRALDRDPQRPDPDRRAVRAATRRRDVLRRPRRTGEGHRRGARDREDRRTTTPDRRQGGAHRTRASLLRRGLRARPQGRRARRRVPRRADPRRPRRAVRRELRLADAGRLAGAVRAGRHRVAGLWHAGHRPPRSAPCPRSSATASTASSATT